MAEGPLPSAAPEKDVIGAIGMVHTELRSLVYERSRKDWGRPWMANVAHELDRVSVSLTAVRFASEHAPDGVFDLDRVQATR
ncbi:hypothetical protein PII48_24450, partial [Serratia sp. 21NM0010]|uniref:hypothetical protein n=1 Tax=Serratia sarumanii TaxID=3020826 RepID=UPI00233155A9